MRRAPTPSGSPQGRSTANRTRGRTALCARGPGARRSGSALPKRTVASATSAPWHPMQRQALRGGRAAPCQIGSPRRELRASPSSSASRHTIRCSVSVVRISKAAAAQVAEGEADDGEMQRGPAAAARRAARPGASGAAKATPRPRSKTMEGARADGERRAAPQPWPKTVEGAQCGAPRVSQAKRDVTRSPDMIQRTVARRVGAQKRESKRPKWEEKRKRGN